jgi:hypothetical protein
VAELDGQSVIAALYVETDGAYYGLPDVDPWDEARDARNYAGPWPVVAHPPCARWSIMGNCRPEYERGDDGGCFAAALDAVRTFGGVLEHPAYSQAWPAFGLPRPSASGWIGSLFDEGWTCYVDQRNYGHPANKDTWLYCVGLSLLPDMRWRRAPLGTVTVRNNGGGGRETRSRTPVAFRDTLLEMAGSARPALQSDRSTRSEHSLEGTAVNGPIPVGQEGRSK